MEYIVILDADTREHSPIENSNWFLEKYSSYELAKDDAEEFKANGDCKSYSIYALCTDDRNHVV